MVTPVSDGVVPNRFFFEKEGLSLNNEFSTLRVNLYYSL